MPPGTLELPKHFTHRINKAMSDKIITKGVRSEIITMIAMGMWQITTHPTSKEYTDICQALIAAYPVLKDTHGNGYVVICCLHDT